MEKKVVEKIRTGVYGLIVKDNKVLLIKKARGGYTGKLDLPGGGLEQHETIEECLKREIMEETGLEIIKAQLIGVDEAKLFWLMIKEKNIWEDLHQVGIIYRVEVKGENKKEPDGLDSNGSEYYEINKLDMNNLTPFAKYAIEHIGF